MKKYLLIAAFMLTGSAFAQTTTPATIVKPAKVQCKGITTKGLQCRRMIAAPSKTGYCFQHNAETDKKNVLVSKMQKVN